MTQRDWPRDWTRQIGQAVRDIRDGRGLSAAELSNRTAELGFRIPRNTIANLENGRKESIPIHEVQLLATALGVPIYALCCYPDGNANVPYLPGRDINTGELFWREYCGFGLSNIDETGFNILGTPGMGRNFYSVEFLNSLEEWTSARGEIERMTRPKPGWGGAPTSAGIDKWREVQESAEDNLASIVREMPELLDSIDMPQDLHRRLKEILSYIEPDDGE